MTEATTPAVKKGPTLSAEALVTRALKAASAEELGAKIADYRVSKGQLKKALKYAVTEGFDVPALEALMALRGIGLVGRGRAAPALDETRLYKAQALKDGGAFLRVPLAPLGVNKGDVVKVSWKDGRVIIRPKVTTAEPATEGEVVEIAVENVETAEAA